MESPLKREFDFYVAHQDELVKEYNGKYIVLKDEKVLGAYDSQVTAVVETQKSHDLGTFLVQRVAAGSGSYTQTFHSRVSLRATI